MKHIGYILANTIVCLFLLKEFLEELDLIIDGVIPIGVVVTSRTSYEIVTYL